MGQIQGKAVFDDSAKPFLNLSEKAMQELWQTFNIVADNWGVNEEQFSAICVKLSDELETPAAALATASSAAFKLFDTDSNNSVDALEFLGAFAICSGMTEAQKITFIFSCYDFSNTASLSIDEMTISMKSTLTGLAKCSGIGEPDVANIEQLSARAFAAAGVPIDGTLPLADFIDYCIKNAVVSSYGNFFEDGEDQTEPANAKDEDLEKEGPYSTAQRSANLEASNNNALEDLNADVTGAKPTETWEAQMVEPINAEGEAIFVENEKYKGLAPDSQLTLEWVHGYRAADTRNNVRYTSTGEIVYHAAGAGIVYSKANEEAATPIAQRFNLDHTDDIVSFAMHPNGNICATGEFGANPKIVVWDSKTMKALKVIRGFHQNAVVHLDFSPDGKKLASIGQDDDRSLAIYEWTAGTKIFTCKTSTSRVLDCRWASDNSVASCGENHVFFFNKTEKKGVFEKKKGIFGKKGKLQAVKCLSTLGTEGEIISGTASGDLYHWVGRNCKKAVPAHSKTVNALFFQKDSGTLVSGGADGVVKVWSRTLIQKAEFNLADVFWKPMPKVRSVCLSEDAGTLLIGTHGSEILEINCKEPVPDDEGNMPEPVPAAGPLVNGHHANELWGLVTHPTKSEFATVGDDKTVRIWSATEKTLLRKNDITSMARCVTYSGDGSQVVVGCQDGSIIVLKEDTLEVEQNRKNVVQGAVTDLKYTADGTLLISHKSNLTKMGPDWEIIAEQGTVNTGKSAITAFEITSEPAGKWARINNAAGEISFIDLESMEKAEDGSGCKESTWASLNCPLQFTTQGIHATTAGVKASVTSVDKSKGSDLLASSDSFGKVKLFRYPSLTPGADCNEFHGHTGNASAVRFITGDTHLISLGGADRSIFQWAVVKDEDTPDSGEEEKPPEEGEEPEPVEEEEPEEGEEGEEKEVVSSSDGLEEEDETAFDGAVVERKANCTAHNDEDLTELFKMESGGSEFMATRPWVAAIKPPPMDNMPPSDEEAPSEVLELEWVHGYRGQDSRDNCFYNPEGEICYIAAGAGIVLNKRDWTQKFQLDHTDDVICIAMSPDGKYCATGQVGKRPVINVWDSSTGKTISSITCGRVRAISALAFSNDGTMLAAVGQDDKHSVSVYDWKDKALKCKASGDGKKVFAIAFTPDDAGLFTVGAKSFRRWTIEGRNLKSQAGHFTSKIPVQNLTCINFLVEKQEPPEEGQPPVPLVFTPIIGAADGSLLKIEGRKVSEVVEAHGKGAVNSIWCIKSDDPEQDGGLVSGGKDGKVILWDATLGQVSSFEVSAKQKDPAMETNTCNPAVRSVCMSSDGCKILVGTEGSEIFEFDARQASTAGEDAPPPFGNNLNEGALVNGHCNGELWGLAVHPSDTEYCTTGDDKYVRVWDLATRKLKMKPKKLRSLSRACAYSPDGKVIAVGLGGELVRGFRGKKNGGFYVLNASDLSEVFVGKDAKDWIQDVKFSPDGFSLAMGSHDNVIYLHNTTDWSVRAMCKSHENAITHLDFSVDNEHIRSNCEGLELIFHNCNTSDKVDADATKDLEWANQSCVLGWAVQGCWPASDDGTSVNAIDTSSSRTLIASADDFGKVKLFRYPCIAKGSRYREYRGHSAHVTNVRFSNSDSHVLTVGGSDRCVFQWKVDGDANAESDAEAVDADDEEGANDIACDGAEFGIETTNDEPGDFATNRPWKSTAVAPDAAPKENNAAPSESMNLQWVHGYRAQDARNNAFYNPYGEICYSSAGVGIIHNNAATTQKFYQGHTGDIISLAISPDGAFVASGQVGAAPLVHVWDAATGAQICVLPRFHKRGIPCVQFSGNGNQIVSVGQDEAHSVAIWSTCSGGWEDGKRAASAKGDSNKVLFAHYTGTTDYALITGGVKHVNFWKLDGKVLSSKKGTFGGKGTFQPILCAATVFNATGGVVMDKQVVTGTANGLIYVWDGRTVGRTIVAHKKAVNTMFATKEGGLISGSRSGTVKVWSSSMEELQKFDINDATPSPLNSAVRSVCIDAMGTRLLVGTQGSEMYEIETDAPDASSATLVSQGHCSDELWGLAMHPTNADLYATAGDDGTVRVWSLSTKKCLRKRQLETMSRAVAWSPDGKQLAVGLGGRVVGGQPHASEGALVVLDAETMATVMNVQESKEWISDVKYSPNGQLVAAASYDNNLYLFDASSYGLMGTCKGHSAAVTHFDFSADSNSIRSTCAGYELRFFSTSTGVEDPKGSATLKNTEWATETCPLGWGVSGVWVEDENGVATEINAVDRSADSKLLAAVDETGAVKIYSYPVTSDKADWSAGAGHSVHVTNARFNSAGNQLITTGGTDRSVFQWALA
jgi:WD40 repeat protein/Ca2+-binding EF-hand superfamily protein